MKIASETEQEVGATLTVAKASGDSEHRRRSLLRAEWLEHGPLIMTCAVTWFLGVFALQLAPHPGVLLAFGLLYAILVPPIVAGRDASDGSLEFSLALPVSRDSIHGTRLLIAGVPLLVFQGVGVLAVLLDWPQAIWGLFVESGMTAPFELASSIMYVLAFIAPVLVLATSFSLVSQTSTARGVQSASIAAAAASALILYFLFRAERLLIWEPGALLPSLAPPGSAFRIGRAGWDNDGWLTLVVGLLVATGILVLSHRLHRRRQLQPPAGELWTPVRILSLTLGSCVVATLGIVLVLYIAAVERFGAIVI